MSEFGLKDWEKGFKSYSLKDLKITQENNAVGVLAECSNQLEQDIDDTSGKFKPIVNNSLFPNIIESPKISIKNLSSKPKLNLTNIRKTFNIYKK